MILISVWWLTYPSEKYEFVSWDDDIPNRWKNKIHTPKPPASWLVTHKKNQKNKKLNLHEY